MAEFDLRDVEAVPYLYVDCTAPADPEKIAPVMDAAFGRLMGFIGERGITPAGAPMTVHHDWGGDSMAFRAAIPVPATDAERAEGGIRSDATPEGRAMHTVHVGPYDGLGETYRALMAHLEAEGLEPGKPAWECYLDDPRETPGDRLRTEIFLAVA